MALTPEQIAALSEPLDPQLVQVKPTTGKPKYIEGVEAFRAANRIFSPDGWGYTTDRIERVDIGSGTLYRAIVTVHVNGCLSKQDVGCKIVGANSAQGHETAMKGAVTDGVKRALRTFGDPLGLVLYDKDADLVGDYREWQQEQGQQEQERPARPVAPARTQTTASGGATTPRQGWAEGVGKAADEEVAARKLYDAVAALMRDDRPLAEALAAKGRTLDDLTVDELKATLVTLRKRASERAQPPADAPTAAPATEQPPDYGPDYTDLHTAISEATDAGDLFTLGRSVADARGSKRVSDDGYGALMRLLRSREAKIGKTGAAR